jgi:carboxymethylenebutenolidase
MRWITAVIAAFVLVAWTARPGFAEVKSMDITFKSGDEEVKGFLAEPEGKGPFPAVVVIQEWWGLTDWIKDNARHLASEGYVALAPDLYRGKVASDMRTAGELMKGLPRDRAVRDLKGAAEALAARTNVDKSRLGSIGWCMGGGYSLQLALHDPRIKACAMCYGVPVTDAEQLKPLQARILGIFGEEDHGIPPDTVHKFEAALKEAGKHVYLIQEFKAGHGFMRPKNPDGQPSPAYREDAAREAWKDIDAFFAKTLKGT